VSLLDPQRWAQIEELFHRVCECDPSQRTRLLEEACDDDLELRRTVEALLASGEGAADDLQAAVHGGLDAVAFPLMGETISHYRILAGIDTGGMGSVYRAEDLKLGRKVALKFLAEEFARDPAALGRFEREARAASALEHPNICSIYEFGEHAGQPFLAMQLLEGHTLRELIARNSHAPFAIRELLNLALQIAGALDAAHRHGIVHRDIKPANIFITTQGQAKLLDFGLAKPSYEQIAEAEPQSPVGSFAKECEHGGLLRPLSTPEAFLSRTGVAIGTSAYMSPEQARGEKLDARTDIFSFGLVLYEMATGQRAFQGATEPILHDVIFRQIPAPVRRLNPALPARLDAIIGKALERDRDSRYQTAADLRADLEAVNQASEGQSRSRNPLFREPGRTMTIAGGTGIAVALLAAGYVALHSLNPHPRRLHAETMQVQPLTDSGRVENVAISRDGRYVAYAQRERGGVGLWVRPVADRNAVQVLPPGEGTAYEGLSFSPSGETLYFVRPDPSDPGFHYLYAMPTGGGPARRLVKDIDSPVSFSPDGHSFVYTRGIPSRNAVEVRIASVDGSTNRLLATVPNTYAGFQPGATWSPDGRTIAVPLQHFGGAPRYALYTVDVTSGRVAQLKPSPSFIGRALWLPEGDSFLTVLGDRQKRGQLWSVSYPQAVPVRLTNDSSDYDPRPDLAGSASALATIVRTERKSLWSVPAAEPSRPQQLAELTQGLDGVREAPDGRLLAIGGGSLWAFTADGRQREKFTELEIVSWWPTVCGRFVVVVAAHDGATELLRFDADGSGLTRLAVSRTSEFNGTACSPDGKYVYYVDMGERQTLWRVATEGGEPREIAPILGDGVGGRMSFSPDGSTLAYPYEEFTPAPAVKLAILPADGGPPLQLINLTDLEGTATNFFWTLLSRDGKNLQYILTEDGTSNIWEQPLAGGERRQLTHFTTGRIVDFSWSRDGSRLLVLQGEVSSDAVLLSAFHSSSGEH